MFKNALVYRIEQWNAPALGDIEERLAREPFVECSATQPESAGWIPPRGRQHGALAESVGGQLVLELCTETKSVPGGVVKAQLQARLDQIERDTGRRPRGKALRELKEALVASLLPRAFPKRSGIRAWVDAEAGVVWVGVANARRADAVVTRLVEQLGGGLKLAQVQTAVSPARAMAQWLLAQEAPSGFSIDRDCELVQPDGEKATVRYARHALDLDEVGEHVRQGKLPTQLALTWAGRVSFVLTEGLALKRIELLDVVLEGAGADAAAGGSRDERFDADVAIATGELRRMLPALIDALGGFDQRQAAAEPAAGADADAAGADPAWARDRCTAG